VLTHTYLEQGLTILQARLKSPLSASHITAEPTVRPFITISREACAGATTAGGLLLQLLAGPPGEPTGPSWAFLDKDLLTHALTQHHLPERLAEFLPEDRVSEITAVIGELVGLHPPLWQLEHQVGEAILQLAQMGRVIFAGRAAHLVTRHLPGGLHVRLIASREVRIRRMMALQNCNATTAAAHIDKTDLARRRYVKTNFDEDIDDPHTYDLVINTDRTSPEIVADMIYSALRLKLTAHPAPVPA
jgi:cytidylate kinase